MAYIARGPDGRPCLRYRPLPQLQNCPPPQPITLWQFVQGAAVVAGLFASLSEISRR